MVAFRRHYSQTFVLSSKEFASLEQRTATYDTSRGSLLAQFQRSTQCGGVVSVTEICVGRPCLTRRVVCIMVFPMQNDTEPMTPMSSVFHLSPRTSKKLN